MSSLGDYVLEIANNRPDYSELSAIKTLNPGDKLIVPNKLLEMISLKHNGEYVKIGKYSLAADMHYFGLDEYSMGPEDHNVGFII